jgi:hypothetical protein
LKQARVWLRLEFGTWDVVLVTGRALALDGWRSAGLLGLALWGDPWVARFYLFVG